MPVGRADIHIHTRVSDGMASVADTLQYVAEQTDLDVVAITDHEDVTGGLRARELAAQRGYRFEVVPGAEITTLQGHLLALYIEQTPKSFRSLDRTLGEIHAQGGLAVVPHPLSWLTRSIGGRAMRRICRETSPDVYFDAIETHNPSLAGTITAKKVAVANRRWRLPGAGGSDAHHLPHVGCAWTEFEGHTADELRRAIETGAIRGGSRGYPPLRDVGVRNLAAGLVWGYAATPRKMASGLTKLDPRRRGRR